MTGDDISWMAVDILTRFWPEQGFPEMHVADLVFEYLGDEVDDVPYELNCSLIEAVRKENRTSWGRARLRHPVRKEKTDEAH